VADGVEILESAVAYDGFFKLRRFSLRHRLFGGGWSPPLTRELLERGHAAAVLPFDPDRDEVVLVEQFRIGALEDERGAWLLEPVAGMIEAGESGERVARREAGEEAGLAIDELAFVADYIASPGGSSERTSLYIGRVRAPAGGVFGIGDEDIRTHVMPLDRALARADAGEIRGANALIALLWLARHRDRLAARWRA
jgi:ADP-ribose pyrophosphatase